MRIILALTLTLALTAGVAAAQPVSGNPPTETILCLNASGQTEPAVCRVPASRLDLREDICLCTTGLRVATPICQRGEVEPVQSARFERVRRVAARDGSLLGDLFEGRAMCVAPRRP